MAARNGELVHIDLNLYFDNEKKMTVFSIIDDAQGIPYDKLNVVISPGASITDNPLNEHGMGLKQAVVSMGKLDYLATKTADAKFTSIVKEFKFGDLDVAEAEYIKDHGTEVRVKIPKNSKMRTQQSKWFKGYCKEYLGARYRRFLRPDNRQAFIRFNFYDVKGNLETTVDVEKVEPIYFHPNKATNEPIFSNFPIKGRDWEASLTFGFAPTKEQCERLGIDEPSRNQTYGVAFAHQGLDLIINDRVLLFHQFQQIGIVEASHPSFNLVRGEIELKKGFTTTVTKNHLDNSVSVSECMEKISKILNGKQPGPQGKIHNYLKRESTPEDLPEALLRDRLKNLLIETPFYHSKEITTEHVIEDLEGFIDVYAEMEDGSYDIWELKNEPARAYDVFQLFMYMTVKQKDVLLGTGYLLATEFSNGAKYAAAFLQEKYKLKITLTTYNTYNINGQPNNEELEKYY